MGIGDFFTHTLKAKITAVLTSRKTREEILEEIEELLILSDISVTVVDTIISGLNRRSKSGLQREHFLEMLKEELLAIVSLPCRPQLPPGKHVVLLVGINGSGKTTTAAKLAHYYRGCQRKVLLAAADTFRAAGSSQLSLWGERLGIPVIGGDRGADPGSVVYNSLQSFQTHDHDCLVIDTAGRVQTKENLMKELEKLVKIVKKFFPEEPTATYLVLDATTGQNALQQAEKFKEFSGISGIVLSKIDGTAKGGSVVTIIDKLRLPVAFVGTGETQHDLLEFSPQEFVDALVDR